MDTPNEADTTNERVREPITSQRSYEPNDVFTASLNAFINDVDGLYAQFGTPKTSIIKSLIDNTCEYRARYQIENASSYNDSARKFDSYFTIKHDFQKNRFVQRLALALRRRGIQTCISTEEKHVVGVFDVVITNAKFLVKISNGRGKKIIVEWKSSASFSMSQMERYLWEATTVILVRAQMGQIIRITRKDIQEYLTSSLIALTERSAAISAGEDLQKIPGPYCKGCPVEKCEFYKAPSNGKKVVSFRSDSMQDDLLLAFNNLEHCIDQAIEVVMKELTS